MFSCLRALLRHKPPTLTLFPEPMPFTLRSSGSPSWLKTLSPARTFSTPAEADHAYRALERSYAIVRERSGETQQLEEAEMRSGLGHSLANERPR